MPIAQSLQWYLDARAVRYDTLTHAHTLRSISTAEASHVPGDNLAKGVLIRSRDGFLLAIIPASRHVDLDAVGTWLKQPVGMATEEELGAIFTDCERGAVPPVGPAYGVSAVIDDELEGFQDIYFEAGDHCTLVHLTGRDFHRLMPEVPHAHISVAHH